MAFKMNTSIGKIYAKIQGTKPHAKAIATAKAPIPATGNVGIPPSPLKKILLGKARTEAKRKAKEAAEKAKNDTLTKAQVAAGRAQEMNDKLTNKAGDPVINAPSTGDSSASASKPKSKAYVKPGGKATGKMSSYKKGSKERYAEYKARGWKQDDTTKGGEGNSTTSTPPSNNTATVNKPVKELKAKTFKEFVKENKSKDTKSTDTKAGSDLVGKSRKETRLDRRLAKTQSKGKAIADGKGTKTPAEQRKALRLKKREGRLKKKIETKTKKGSKKGIPITEQGKLNRVGKKDESKSKKITKEDFKIDKNLGKVDLKSSIDPTNIMSNRKKPVNKYGKDYKIKI